jgi:hypothetical protein
MWSATEVCSLRVTTALAKHAAGQVAYRISCGLCISLTGADFKDLLVIGVW